MLRRFVPVPIKLVLILVGNEITPEILRKLVEGLR